MGRYLKRIYKQAKLFKSLTGVGLKEFWDMVRKVRPQWEAFQRSKKVSGRPSKLDSLADEVLLVLIYYKYYTSFRFLELIFDMSESNICRHIQRMERMLARVVKIDKDRALSNDQLKAILIDATEIQIQRPKRNQRKFYSGKKKRHTMKVEIQATSDGKIINISSAYCGRTHDFKIRKQEAHVPEDVLVLADSGYQGLQKIHTKTMLPHKRRRKCPLTDEQRAENTELASRRIVVEHIFANLKRFKILSSTYRNFHKKLHLRFNIIAGIYNLRFA